MPLPTSLKTKRYDLDTDAFTALETQRKALQLAAESLQHERNSYSKTMGKTDWRSQGEGRRH